MSAYEVLQGVRPRTPSRAIVAQSEGAIDMSHISTVTPTFAELALNPKLLEALAQQGYTTPTPIQAQAIPVLLGGRDLWAWRRPAPARRLPSCCRSFIGSPPTAGRRPRAAPMC